jgi:hypothetical protein
MQGLNERSILMTHVQWQLRVALNDAWNVVEIVRDAGGNLVNCFYFLGMTH